MDSEPRTGCVPKTKAKLIVISRWTPANSLPFQIDDKTRKFADQFFSPSVLPIRIPHGEKGPLVSLLINDSAHSASHMPFVPLPLTIKHFYIAAAFSLRLNCSLFKVRVEVSGVDVLASTAFQRFYPAKYYIEGPFPA